MSEFNPRLAHLGIFCKDLDAMIAFYTKEFGMIVTDSGLGKSGKAGTRRRGAFLSADPSEHHQLALIEGRDPGDPADDRADLVPRPDPGSAPVILGPCRADRDPRPGRQEPRQRVERLHRRSGRQHDRGLYPRPVVHAAAGGRAA